MMLAFDDKGHGLPVVLIHGFPLCRQMWQPQVEELSRSGYRVITPDLPGFVAEPPEGWEPVKESYVDWAIGLLEALYERGGPVHLVGHDWGCLISLRAASLRPELLQWGNLIALVLGTLFIAAYAWQVAEEARRMSDALAADGYAATDRIEEADLVLLNTCHIREKAAEKVYSELGRIRELKQERALSGRQTIVGVAGCVAQAEGREIARRAPVVDLVIGPQTYHRLPDAVRRARAGERVVETGYAVEDKFEHLPAPAKAAAPPPA